MLSSGETERFETLLDSTLESVDAAEAMVTERANEHGFDDEAVHKLGMAVREAMVNAVVHGNRYNGNKKVHFRLEHSAERIAVVIGDEGEGFDPSTLPDPLAEENLLRQSGRGILLMRAFTDRFEIERREPNGMEFRLTKYKNNPPG
jgi:serine/threonine-protein kinase RsbW